MKEEYKNSFYEEYFNAHISAYEGKADMFDFAYRSIIYEKYFSECLPSDSNSAILDIGCGNGSILWWLQNKGFLNSEGIDLNHDQIEIGKKLGVKNIKCGDWRDYLKGKDSLYSVIFLRDVIEHFNKEEVVNLLKQCLKSLKKRGKVIIQVPNAASPFFGRIRYGDFTHELAFTKRSLLQLLKTCSYKKIQIKPVEPVSNNFKSYLRFLLWKAVAFCYKLILLVEIGNEKEYFTQDIIAIAER